ncbi:RNA polymerase subunit sigma-70 [Microbacterium sp. CH12i]|uniref:RNA polymerase sigma factor n=1 Tax=Microbacterium sp. CH12i TaxID=1479651 RepID=UPI000460F3F5|nr:sigma-70 family RNA polymerase sigma factor [Microbacterium sp. CH12i]KDA04765.1 RNA polymerase subunit sigma-70 [Microbacterium sp. CH12i]
MTDASPEGAVSDDPPRWERAADLFADWRAGDARAMDGLVRLMTPVLWHVVRAYGLERMHAEDVVQSTWLSLVRSAESIIDARAISGWLTVTARREAWRVSKNHRRAAATADEILEPMLPPQESTEAQVAASDESARLWAAVRTLAERCQRLLRIVAFDERPDYAAIAADLEMPIGSIGPTRKRCLAKLRTALTTSGFHDAPLDQSTPPNHATPREGSSDERF